MIYRERRLQPFWNIGCTAHYAYENARDYRVPVGEHVTEVMVEDAPRPVTGLARAGGSTFEHYVGKVLDAEFLLNAGVEMAGLFIPGARLAEIVISRSFKAGKAKLAH